MADYVTLLGAEDVARAASSMRESAHAMQMAADTIQFALENHQRVMWEWLEAFKAAQVQEVDGGR